MSFTGRHAIRAQRPVCWLAAFGYMEDGSPMTRCDGAPVVRCHIILQQVLKRYGGDPWDRRAWVWGCGSWSRLGGHHSDFDVTKRLRLRRQAIPYATERLAEELEIEWWLTREYGRRTDDRT